MRPKKQLIEAAKKDGTFDRINQLLSLAYLIRNKAYALTEEADDLLRSHGLLIGRTKQLSSRLEKAFDEYVNDFKDLIRSSNSKEEFFGDYDSFSRMVHAWAELPENFTPGAKEDGDSQILSNPANIGKN